jgi:sugar phosphate permease
MTRPSSSVVVLWLSGVLAAAQLGKFTAMAPGLRADFGLSLPELGWLISLLEIGGALFGFAAGVVLGRVGARRMMVVGLVLLAATGIAEAASRRSDRFFLPVGAKGLAICWS